ncbi:ribonuclease J [Malonomonas rubra DSM 5091]|uniref:Ribonuclease J n=1 Tax=Malonomonas rubra DSM 5091 TaxID=1122189 RepID=A0A1M6I7W7_MALRU|nr:ribonuclease J [Malonomonas rubra]SHJ30549.1 ribonuclease J [Malonomonas rubra DSM 5091]
MSTETSEQLSLYTLGGLGEIGMNMMAIEYAGKILLVDCGLMFPEAYMMGIDLVLPDISSLEGRQDDIIALVLTHGHEDHIGAIPFLWRDLGEPAIYATGLTLGLLRSKLKEFELDSKVPMIEIQTRQKVDLFPFEIEPFRAAHSIVDGVGLAIRTPIGLIVHTGDFKIDQTPVDGQNTDLARLAEFGEEGVLLLLADSTNVENDGYTLSERTVKKALEEIIPQSVKRVVVATFSSNIHRIQQIADVAASNNRKLLINGRSMVANIDIARKLGYLKIAEEQFIDLRDMRSLPPEEVLIITTGSQGEPLSALMRIALGDHKQIELERGDTVILSSKFIPGNEKAISDLINNLYRRGAEVFYEKTSEIHVSGHASREELKLVHNLTRPKYFMPVHGEYRHLVKHAQLAQEMGIDAENCFVVDNGYPLLITAEGAELGEKCETGRVFVDGKGVGDVGAMQLRDRRHLANHGLVILMLAINQSTGKIVQGPELFSKGFIEEESEENNALLDEAKQAVCDLLDEHSLDAVSDWEELRVEVRKALRRCFNKKVARRPLILPVILQL